jgi:small GTP-binding protein
MTQPLIAIVGRPNVGKSTLFNRLVGGRPALVHGTPGLTRDRRYGECDYFGAEMRVVDTGGLDPDAGRDVIGAGIHRQAMRAIGEADALLLVVDGRAGLSAIDQELAGELRASPIRGTSSRRSPTSPDPATRTAMAVRTRSNQLTDPTRIALVRTAAAIRIWGGRCGSRSSDGPTPASRP